MSRRKQWRAQIAFATTGQNDNDELTGVCVTGGNLERRRQPLDLAPYKDELAGLYNEFGKRICCLVTEPYLGGGGSYHPQHEYLQMLEHFCRQYDIVFILDEVQSNFGRTGVRVG